MAEYLYNLPNATGGMDSILIQTLTNVPILTPLLLLFTWGVVFFGGVGNQKIRGINADYSMWSVVASLSTMMIALIMSVSVGFIRLDWLIIVITITIFSGVWFFLDRKITEV